jgi:hypothetical protein
MLVRWVVMRTRVEAEVDMRRCMVYLMAQSDQVSCKYLCPKREGSHLSIFMLKSLFWETLFKWLGESLTLLGPWGQMMKLVMTGDSGEPIAMPSVCLWNWPAKLKYEEVRTWQKSLRISSSECQPRRLMASLISILVKSDTTLKLTHYILRVA